MRYSDLGQGLYSWLSQIVKNKNNLFISWKNRKATKSIACINECCLAHNSWICIMLEQVMFSCGKYNLVHEFFRKLQKSSIPNSLTYRGILIYFCIPVNHLISLWSWPSCPVVCSSREYVLERGENWWGHISCPRNGNTWNCRFCCHLLWSSSMPLCSWKRSWGTDAGVFCYSYFLLQLAFMLGYGASWIW